MDLRGRDGGAASLELVILFPALLALVAAVLQGALWYHARNVASAAAQEGVRAARVEAGTLDAGRERAGRFIAAAGGAEVLSESAVAVSGDAASVRVVVSGRSVSLLPGVPGPRVEQSAAGPIERFTPAG